jgi:hypothetical protein
VTLGRRDQRVGGGHLGAQVGGEHAHRAVDLRVALEAPARRAVAAGVGAGRHVAEGEVGLHAVVARAGAEQIVQREHDGQAARLRDGHQPRGQPRPVVHVHEVRPELVEPRTERALDEGVLQLVPALEEQIVAVHPHDRRRAALVAHHLEGRTPLDAAGEDLHRVAARRQRVGQLGHEALRAADQLGRLAVHDEPDAGHLPGAIRPLLVISSP